MEPPMTNTKYCKDCKWVSPVTMYGSEFSELYCSEPDVVSQDPAALSNSNTTGTSCFRERLNTGVFGFFVVCGRTGKKWETKNND